MPKLWTFEAFTQVQYNERTRSKLRALVGTGGRLRLHQGISIGSIWGLR
ncbi:MAG: hypothetical protein U5L45_15990 [Saprospiraceae bacterium]|nr:hypothetical protein [Saprospiraceae bacterium]